MFFVSTRVTCTLNITCHYFITLSIYEALHCTIFSNLPLLSLSDVQLYSLIPCSRIPPHPVLEHFNTLFSNTSTPCSRTPLHPVLEHLNTLFSNTSTPCSPAPQSMSFASCNQPGFSPIQNNKQNYSYFPECGSVCNRNLSVFTRSFT